MASIIGGIAEAIAGALSSAGFWKAVVILIALLGISSIIATMVLPTLGSTFVGIAAAFALLILLVVIIYAIVRI